MIEEKVLSGIDGLKNFKEIKITNVFENRYRVNVWCSYKPEGCITDYTGLKIDYSYFIRVDEEGKITYCNPELGVKCASNTFKKGSLPTKDG